MKFPNNPNPRKSIYENELHVVCIDLIGDLSMNFGLVLPGDFRFLYVLHMSRGTGDP